MNISDHFKTRINIDFITDNNFNNWANWFNTLPDYNDYFNHYGFKLVNNNSKDKVFRLINTDTNTSIQFTTNNLLTNTLLKSVDWADETDLKGLYIGTIFVPTTFCLDLKGQGFTEFSSELPVKIPVNLAPELFFDYVFTILMQYELSKVYFLDSSFFSNLIKYKKDI